MLRLHTRREKHKFRPAFLNLAKAPEGGIVYLMARAVGQLKARDILYRARPVSGREAFEIGLADALVSEEALMDEAAALAREMAAAPPLAFGLAKRMFNADVGSFDQFVDLELNAIADRSEHGGCQGRHGRVQGKASRAISGTLKARKAAAIR